ncbi:head decoration protein [Nocardia sp. NPDC101769]|uniref:head decoration protein n=1 Tax=Nocardia sp. NPDC101769 TaxID=3364333 RepID=UPI00381B0587
MSFIDDMQQGYTVERLLNTPWLIGGIYGVSDERMTPAVVLDVTKFTQATHYPNNRVMVPGVVLGKITATGKYGPYDPNASDGRQTATGFLLSPSILVPAATEAQSRILLSGFVQPAYLPAASGLDAAARTALRNIVFLDV